jgi:hypothetical protein
MGALNRIDVLSSELGESTSLSPEYWLSMRHASQFSGGVPLWELAALYRETASPDNDCLTLDTGNADRGLLSLSMLGQTDRSRVSVKKVVPEGAVLLSRLRPYLRQVAFIPSGLSQKLRISRVMCSTEFYVLRSQHAESIAFLVPWLLSNDVQDIFAKATTGGHHPRFDEDLLGKLTVPIGMVERRDEISQTVATAVNDHVNAQMVLHRLSTGND